MRGKNPLPLLFLAAIIAFLSFAVACRHGEPAQGATPTPAPTPSSSQAPMPATGGMVRIPAGTFTMGCAPGERYCEAYEQPRHMVTLSPFFMDIHEVTVAEYGQCVSAGKCKKPHSKRYDQEVYNWDKPGRENYPVNGVSWNDANTYCRWRGKRLPTEAEFEYALRGGNEGYLYPWGNDDTPPPRFGNYADESARRRFPAWTWILDGYDDGYVYTSPVCSFTRNAYGLCDIGGNVGEWTADWYGENYYQSSPPNNPPGASSGWTRVLRGGNFVANRWYFRAASREHGEPTYWNCDLGFRCARD